MSYEEALKELNSEIAGLRKEYAELKTKHDADQDLLLRQARALNMLREDLRIMRSRGYPRQFGMFGAGGPG